MAEKRKGQIRMAKVFAISPTMLGEFAKCPRSYEAKYVTKEVQFSESLARLYGSLIHKGIEDYLIGTAELPHYSEGIRPLLDYLKRSGWTLFVELELGITRDYQACSYKSKDAWQRCKADLVLFNGKDKAIVIDWKTDAKYDANDAYGDKTEIQRNILALCVGIHYNVQELATMFIYVAHDKCKRTTFDFRDGVGAVLNTIKGHTRLVSEFERVRDTGEYKAKKNGLCKAYCDVYSCEHNGRADHGSKAS